jgi:hypothetical protein
MPRPPYSSRHTATTIGSTSTYTHSSAYSPTSTALTSPSIGSPKKPSGVIEHMPVLSEGSEISMMDSTYASETSAAHQPPPVDELIRGPSVRDRASRFEQHGESSTPRAHHPDMSRTRSTSPLRFTRRTPVTTPTPHTRRVPVPSTAPVQRIAQTYEGSNELAPRSLKRPSPELKRGTGSAKRMIQQWENLPPAPGVPPKSRVPSASPMSARTLTREYLDQKPLPVPGSTPIPASDMPYGRSPSRNLPSPSRTSYAPSPLQHLQTPQQNRKRSSTLSPSLSNYSLSPSPSGEKRKKGQGRSPLREIMGVFGGGIQAMGRRVVGKGKERAKGRESYGTGRDENAWSESMTRVGTNGLPGGIVFSDRMGDQEMEMRGSEDPNVGE